MRSEGKGSTFRLTLPETATSEWPVERHVERPPADERKPESRKPEKRPERARA